GLLHRDISPDNVMLSFDSDDRCLAKIIDLGIAKDVTSGVSADVTQAGVLIGNPKYMSPEQLGLLGDGEQVDGRADLYCLGVVLYEMLLGVPPFASETPHGYIMKHLTQTPRRFADAKPNIAVPDGVESVIFRALEKDRAKRYASARDFAAALAPFLEAPAGTLTREDVDRVRRGPEVSSQPIRHDAPTVADVPLPKNTEEKAHEFELELLDGVYEREGTGDREGLQRLAEAHPPGTAVGDAARTALLRLLKLQEAEIAFQRAWEDGRSAAWREYLEHHGDSARADEARRLVDEAASFEAAATSDSETAVRQFLVAWPDTRHHLEAGILLAKLKQRAAEVRAYEDARAMNSPSGWRLYLTAYPSGAHADEARERMSAFEKAAAKATADAVHAKEPADWETAFETGTAAAWDRYLAAHPESPRIVEARGCRQEALDFELASATNKPAMWRAFIKSWPNGRHRMEAEIRIGKT
ncbi:MAG TPA: serine/threonine-protein kinase, partial [Thermoanaerobaculia bacterium]|nr:serine/threonine-protein kinase [Thermoanaerobaculia bacterium]